MILTNKHIISFLAEDKKYIYTPLNEIHKSSLAVKGYAMDLFINERKMHELFRLNSESDIPPYLEIIYDMVVFLRNNG